VLLGEQEVNGRWVEHYKTDLTQLFPLDEDAEHRMLERVREQSTHLDSRPRTSTWMSNTQRPRRRAPAPPRPSTLVYSPATPERLIPTVRVRTGAVSRRTACRMPTVMVTGTSNITQSQSDLDGPRTPSTSKPQVLGPFTPVRRKPRARRSITFAGATPHARPIHTPLETHHPLDHLQTVQPTLARPARHLTGREDALSSGVQRMRAAAGLLQVRGDVGIS
jgi:hypothetical protein